MYPKDDPMSKWLESEVESVRVRKENHSWGHKTYYPDGSSSEYHGGPNGGRVDYDEYGREC